MPEFQLDTSGGVFTPGSALFDQTTRHALKTWADLDAFTQGYIEALFFTEGDELTTAKRERETGAPEPEDESDESRAAFRALYTPGFSDLAPEALARIVADCAAFKASDAWTLAEAAESAGDPIPDDTQAGRDFWYTRNGHGCGFWGGDWPEPYATRLTEAAEACGPVDAYLGDDGRVHLTGEA
jgi:hypothetical protein